MPDDAGMLPAEALAFKSLMESITGQPVTMRQITREMMDKAAQEGADAHACGLDVEDCPKFGGSTLLRLKWIAAWDRADTEADTARQSPPDPSEQGEQSC